MAKAKKAKAGMKLTFIGADGTERDLGTDDSLRAMQKAVGGMIQPVYMGKHKTLLLNEDGKLVGLPINAKANEICKLPMPGDFIVGNVVLAENSDWDFGG